MYIYTCLHIDICRAPRAQTLPKRGDPAPPSPPLTRARLTKLHLTTPSEPNKHTTSGIRTPSTQPRRRHGIELKAFRP